MAEEPVDVDLLGHLWILPRLLVPEGALLVITGSPVAHRVRVQQTGETVWLIW